MPNADLIDLIQEQWARERPDLASGGFGVVGRLLLLGKLLERRVSRVLAPLDLSLWAFDVLATLRRQGPPYRSCLACPRTYLGKNGHAFGASPPAALAAGNALLPLDLLSLSPRATY